MQKHKDTKKTHTSYLSNALSNELYDGNVKEIRLIHSICTYKRKKEYQDKCRFYYPQQPRI